MHEIQADMRLSEQDDVYAYGQVMIDRCIKFPVQMRRYIDNESGEEKAFLSYPRKEYKGEWKDVVSPDQELRAKINQAVGEAIKKNLERFKHAESRSAVCNAPCTSKERERKSGHMRGRKYKAVWSYDTWRYDQTRTKGAVFEHASVLCRGI